MKRTAEGDTIDYFSRPLHGLLRETPLDPAMNRWAIISRPLAQTGAEEMFLRKATGTS